MDNKKIEKAVNDILEAIGENPKTYCRGAQFIR